MLNFMKKFAKITVYILLVFGVMISGVILWYFAVTSSVKFDDEKLKKYEASCVVYSKNNEVISSAQEENYVEGDKIPESVKNAFIAIEDRRFYSHNGVDLRAIARATKNNILSLSAKEGASTISQQLIKNTFLSGEKTLERKMKELKLTLQLEKRYSKDEILEMYLNTVYFGEGASGIGVASKRYFGVSVEDLTPLQGATLAGIIKSPSLYDPYKNYSKAKARRNLVLSKMLEENYITKAEYDRYIAEEIILNSEDFSVNYGNLYYSAIDEALAIMNFDRASDFNGYKIYTSLDENLSLTLPSSKDYGLKCNYSVIVIDNKTKSVVALNRDVGDIRRCPASAAKPWLVYAPAIEENFITEATLIDDTPTSFGDYNPKNVGEKYHGLTSAKECLYKSLNVPSVKIVNGLGVKTVKKYAEKLDITYENDDLSIALGNLAGGITLKELASAYIPFSNGGKYSKASAIIKIVNPNGKKVYERKLKETQVFSSETAYIVSDMLKETAKSGTTKKLGDLGYEIYSKSGTNGDESGNIDAYCVAYTPDYTVAVWLGNADNGKLSNEISGGTYPASICREVFKSLYKGKKPEELEIPSGVIKVKIDKEEYLSNAKLYLSKSEKSAGLYFYFKSGTEPKETAEKEIMPNVKSYKITYNKRKIKLIIETDKDIYYRIFDGDKNLIFDSKSSNKHFEISADEPNKEYEFYLQAYEEKDDEIIFGEIIKLPSVKSESRHDKQNEIIDKPWWED